MLKLIAIVAAAAFATSSPPKEALPGSIDPDLVRAIPVQHDGRCMPLDTLARDLVESATGKAFYHQHDPVLWLLAWTFDPQTWMNQPLIRIANAELRGELRLSSSQTIFSFAELANHQPLHELIEGLAHIEPGRKPNPLESKVQDINDRLMTLQNIFQGQAIRLIPDPQSSLNAWKPMAGDAAHEVQVPESVRTAWSALRDAHLADDGPAFAAAAQQLTRSLAGLPAAYRPSESLIQTELRYNALRPFRTAWMLMLGGAVLSAGAVCIRRRGFDFLVGVVLLAGFGVLTWGLSMRWQLAGRIPASNMFESLLFLGWGIGLVAVLAALFVRQRLVSLTAAGMAALALVLADCLPIDHFIRPIAPVLLDTVWMSIHVPIIMLSYSVLALAVLIAHVQVLAMAVAPGRRQLADSLDAMHYWYVHAGSILLVAGIITGSMWAASSWGRYWGWDPKEVWSLVAFLGYMGILHVRLDRDRTPRWAFGVAALLVLALLTLIGLKLAPLTPAKLLALAGAGVAIAVFVLARGTLATALKSILAFWLIIMTYVGVNYVLGIGLHSYGFGTGAVVRYMFTLGAADLLLVAVCCGIYAVRSGWGFSPASRVALPGPA